MVETLSALLRKADGPLADNVQGELHKPVPLGSKRKKVKKCLDDLSALVKAFNPDEPRDKDGKWTTGGIPGMPADAVIKDQNVQEALKRGAFDLQAKERTGTFVRPGESYDVLLRAKQAGGAAPYTVRADRPQGLYDPRLAELKTLDAGTAIERQIAVPKEGIETELKPLDDKDVLYRGMSAEEWDHIQKTGSLQSHGDFNLGKEQEGATFFSPSHSTAVVYADSFAPWHQKATFDKPAYVVAIKKPEGAEITSPNANEIGIKGPIPKSYIVAAWKGQVYDHLPGYVELHRDRYSDAYTEGSRSSPSNRIAWSRIDLSKRMAKVARTLYVNRPVLNANDIIKWAKNKLGLETCIAPDDMHVTIAFSRTPLEWPKALRDVSMTIRPQHPTLALFGPDKDCLVLKFYNEELAGRWAYLRSIGASWDWPGYEPHITLSYKTPFKTIPDVPPYDGEIVFGPEEFAELKEDWKAGVVEKAFDPSEPRDKDGKWTDGAGGFTDEQANAIQAYTNTEYKRLNSGLRDGAQLSKEDTATMRALDSAMRPIDPSKTLYRGIYSGVDLKPGQTFMDRAFTSTSTDKDIAFGPDFSSRGNVGWDCYVRGATKGIDVSKANIYGDGQDNEAEVILPRQTKFRVASLDSNKRLAWLDVVR